MRQSWHSSSTLAEGAGCEYAWFLTNVLGLREPEIAWLNIATGKVKPSFRANSWQGGCTFKQRGASFGKYGHAQAEAWFKGGKPDWESQPGRALACASHLYPHPSKCDEIEVEAEIGDEPSGMTYAPGTPWAYGQHKFIMTVHGVRLAGTRDLLVRSAAECKRLGTLHSNWLLLDHKFRSVVKPTPDQPDPFIYWDTVPKLLSGVQSNLYALDVMRKTGEPHCQGRWVNMSNKADPAQGRPNVAKAVDFIITKDHALNVLAELIPLARRLDSIQTLAQAERNPETCFKFGGQPGRIGCSHHVSNGGTCDIKHTPGQLFNITTHASFGAAMSDPNNDFLASLNTAAQTAPGAPPAMPWSPPTVAYPGPSAVPAAPAAAPPPAAPVADLPWMQAPAAAPAAPAAPAAQIQTTIAPPAVLPAEAPAVVDNPKPKRTRRTQAELAAETPPASPVAPVAVPDSDPRSTRFWDLLVALAMSPASAAMTATDVASRALALAVAGECAIGESTGDGW